MASGSLELVLRGEEAVVAFACRGCGAIFPDTVIGARELAEGHCTTACACGRTLSGGSVLCSTCSSKELAEREERLFAQAGKVSIDDYPDQPLYWEGHPGSMGEGFFLNVDELCDYYDDEHAGLERRGIPFPKYVWACTEKTLELSAEDVAQGALSGYVGVDVDFFTEESFLELQTLLDTWCKKQDARRWAPDFTRAVLLVQREGG